MHRWPPSSSSFCITLLLLLLSVCVLHRFIQVWTDLKISQFKEGAAAPASALATMKLRRDACSRVATPNAWTGRSRSSTSIVLLLRPAFVIVFSQCLASSFPPGVTPLLARPQLWPWVTLARRMTMAPRLSEDCRMRGRTVELLANAFNLTLISRFSNRT